MKTWILALGALACASSAQAADAGREAIDAAIEADADAAIERLRDWIALPTIANMGINHMEGAQYMAQLARDAGFQEARIVETGGVPAVFATLDAGAEHTLGIYFMYDVKHYDESEWIAPPLEGKILPRDGEGTQLIGRGAINQKGPEMAFLTALKAFKDTGTPLPVNLVLVAEGEEEIGSPNFSKALTSSEVRQALDGAIGIMMPGGGQGLKGDTDISLGAKGVVELQLIASQEAGGRGPSKDIHSSLHAIVDSPAWRLVKALDTLVADDGHTPAIDGWFENVKPLSERQLEIIDEGMKLYDEDETKMMMAAYGIVAWIDDEDPRTRWIRLVGQPTVNIQGLVAGYTGPGGKTVLPGRAEAKIDLRLVPDMTYDEAVAKLRAHLDKRGFTDIQLVASGGYSPTQTDEDSVLVQALKNYYDAHDIEYALTVRNAGSWPGVMFTGAPLNLPAVHFGMGRGGGAHAPDEWILIDSEIEGVEGYVGQAKANVDFLYEVAKAADAAD
ncbi:M20/M25/M40 family metallo-hydrolase [Sphingomicrobium nitratireducens]|uniref:M20/M25/M40 family metallo-hydrolase n=1 Tax=Sphingomicrobium nitratireducens TaxID=2964666 RepID=UPI00223F4F1B|nr:M20/M25/M40 family metallo-hydrolase [Sphingomicrobium nitratireducens]